MAQRRTIRSQSWSVSSAGPFAAALAAASNLSVGSGVFVFFFSLAHLTASARFRAGPQGPYPAGYAGRPAGGTGHDVPVSRCVSAAGIRFSVIRCPPRSWALLTVGLPDADSHPDLDGVTAFRTHELRPGWVPPIPRGQRCSSRPRDVLGQRLPLFRGESFDPAPTFPSTQGYELRGISRRFRFFTRPACPSPVAPGWVGRPWASSRASHPAVTGGARRGRGQVVEHGPGTTRSHQADPPIR